MKKKILILLCIIITLSLCSCDSSDYRKAMSLYNEGDFSAAREIFDGLGDYKNAREMCIDCEYNMAIGMIDDEDYVTALKILESLGEYKDSAEYISKIKWRMLQAYIHDNGKSKRAGGAALSKKANLLNALENDGDATVYLYAEDEDNIALEIVSKWKESGVSCDIDLKVSIERENPIAEWSGTMKIVVLVMYTDESFGGNVDLSTFKKGSPLKVSVYEKETNSVNGDKSYSSDSQDSLLANEMTNVLTVALDTLPIMLEETGLPITVKDLGFLSLE